MNLVGIDIYLKPNFRFQARTKKLDSRSIHFVRVSHLVRKILNLHLYYHPKLSLSQNKFHTSNSSFSF